MKKITLELTDEAYETLKSALAEHDELAEEHTVRSWLELELNTNTEVVVEMLLSDY